MTLLGRCLLALSMAGTAGTALAQDVEAVPGQRFRPPVGDGIFDVYTGSVSNSVGVEGGLWLNYARKPVVISNGGGVLVRDRLDADLVVGFIPMDNVELGLGARATTWQKRGKKIRSTYGNVGGGMGDLRLVTKVGLLRGFRGEPLDVAWVSTLSVPAGGRRDHLSDSRVTASPEFAASYDLEPVLLALNIGAHLRSAVEIGTFRIGHEWTYRFGARLLGDDIDLPIDIDAALSGSTAMRNPFKSAVRSPLELGAAVRVPFLEGQGAFHVGFSGGLVGGYNEPAYRAVAGVVFHQPVDRAARVERRVQCPDGTPVECPPCAVGRAPCAAAPVGASPLNQDSPIGVITAAPADAPPGPESGPTTGQEPPKAVGQGPNPTSGQPPKAARPDGTDSTAADSPEPKKRRVGPGGVAPAFGPNDPKADSDKDGVPNGRDGAPYVPEDRDGYEDDDGVPEHGPDEGTE